MSRTANHSCIMLLRNTKMHIARPWLINENSTYTSPTVYKSLAGPWAKLDHLFTFLVYSYLNPIKQNIIASTNKNKCSYNSRGSS